MFMAGLLITVKIWKQYKCPSINEWIKMYSIYVCECIHTQTHTMEYYSVILYRPIQYTSAQSCLTLWNHIDCEPNSQAGRVEGYALILSCESSKAATHGWTTINRRMLDPTKKWYPTSKGKGEASKDDRSGKIMFRIKSHNSQKLWGWGGWGEVKQNIGCSRIQRPQRDWARPTFECLSVSCGGMDQQWLATGTGALPAAELGHPVWPIIEPLSRWPTNCRTII